MSTLDEPIDQLYDAILAVERRAVELERDFRDLAHRDDLAVDTLGAETTPAECIAQVAEALATMRRYLDAAEDARSAAKNPPPACSSTDSSSPKTRGVCRCCCTDTPNDQR
ncbi:hypothetical protein [Gordonia sputi]